MLKHEFREWLLKDTNKKMTADFISRCGRIERSLGIDLDEEYLKDEGQSLIAMLMYSSKDEREGIPIPGGISFSGKTPKSMRMSEIRVAVKRYFKFMKENHKLK